MQAVNQRVKGMKFTAYAVGANFVSMLFVLISLGVPWFQDGNKSQATLLFAISRNSGPSRKAGDPAFALLFIAGFIFLFALNGLYCRWAGRATRLPHSGSACSLMFGVSSFFMFLSFCSYAGVVNSASGFYGHYGPGFGMVVFMFLCHAATAVALWTSKAEIDNAAEKLPEVEQGAGSPGMDYTKPVAHAHPLHFSNITARWGKAKVHSTATAVAMLNLLFLIMCLGLPWWEVDQTKGYPDATPPVESKPPQLYGLMQTFVRIPSGTPLRKAGDVGFAFAFMTFLAQIYATIAVTLRFLGRNDGFSGRFPHSLKACLASTGVSAVCSFFAFVCYAGVYNTHKVSGFQGVVQGGFALSILVWLLVTSSCIVLFLKRKEVDDAAAAFGDGSTVVTAFPPEGHPNPGFAAPVPVAFGQAPTYAAPASTYAYPSTPPPAYNHGYPGTTAPVPSYEFPNPMHAEPQEPQYDSRKE